MVEDPDPSDRPTIPHRNRATGIEVAVAIKSPKWRSWVLDAEALCHQAVSGVLAVVDPLDVPMEVSVVLADDELLQRLNRESRGVDRTTNVLAFPCDSLGESVPVGAPRMLGDVVISCDTVSREASQRGTPFADHLRHLVVHGTLHLLDHRHDSETEAEVMEELEASILAEMGIPDPYADGVALIK